MKVSVKTIDGVLTNLKEVTDVTLATSGNFISIETKGKMYFYNKRHVIRVISDKEVKDGGNK